MKYHELLKLPFPDTVLAKFLHVSLPTITKLRHDEPVRQQTIRDIGLLLTASDAEILDALESIQARKRQPGFKLNPNKLHGPLNRKPLPIDNGNHFALSSVLIGPHHLLVTIVPDTPTIRKRLNHRLYADHWQLFPQCPLADLPPVTLRSLMRAIFHQGAPVIVIADPNYHHHSFLPYQLAMLLALKAHTTDEPLYFDLHHEAVQATFNQTNLHHQQQVLNRFTQLTSHLQTVNLNRSLSLQAAYLVALAAQKLPRDQLTTNHIHLQTVDSLLKDPLLAKFIRFDHRQH